MTPEEFCRKWAPVDEVMPEMEGDLLELFQWWANKVAAEYLRLQWEQRCVPQEMEQ